MKRKSTEAELSWEKRYWKERRVSSDEKRETSSPKKKKETKIAGQLTASQTIPFFFS